MLAGKSTEKPTSKLYTYLLDVSTKSKYRKDFRFLLVIIISCFDVKQYEVNGDRYNCTLA